MTVREISHSIDGTSKVLDPHETPPPALKNLFKTLQKFESVIFESQAQIIDFSKLLEHACHRKEEESWLVAPERVEFVTPAEAISSDDSSSISFESIPGLQIHPNLANENEQVDLLNEALHGCLADRSNLTNVDFHHRIPYSLVEKMDESSTQTIMLKPVETHQRAASFFKIPEPDTVVFPPLDDAKHRVMTLHQFLNDKIRWITIGGQYDWTRKAYSATPSAPISPKITAFMRREFVNVRPEAGIINIYKSRDSLSMHRDVSEESSNTLVSISLGCDGIFVIALDSGGEAAPIKCVILRLKSGDVVTLSGLARHAWHGLPLILPGTCPKHLVDWPFQSGSEAFERTSSEQWRGFLQARRVNISIRQMYN